MYFQKLVVACLALFVFHNVDKELSVAQDVLPFPPVPSASEAGVTM